MRQSSWQRSARIAVNVYEVLLGAPSAAELFPTADDRLITPERDSVVRQFVLSNPLCVSGLFVEHQIACLHQRRIDFIFGDTLTRGRRTFRLALGGLQESLQFTRGMESIEAAVTQAICVGMRISTQCVGDILRVSQIPHACDDEVESDFVRDASDLAASSFDTQSCRRSSSGRFRASRPLILSAGLRARATN
jgi:hypothetical protein